MDEVELWGPVEGRFAEILTVEALDFVAALHRALNPAREALLGKREERQRELDRGASLDFLAETADVRAREWKVTPVPKDLRDRRVEITGPTDRKMVINALNSEARAFMADFEDANAPTWGNMVGGQVNLLDAVRRTIELRSPDGRVYELKDEVATLLVRARGWHLVERHVRVDGEPVSASLFDFGLYAFHNAKELLAQGTGPYFYLPKIESHLEARLWADAFAAAERTLGLARGTIKATVLIETIPAVFEMDEILYELREHAAGLNAGRWDYIFSIIKKFRNRPEFVLPDRDQITMTQPFMRAYTGLLVRTCHRRGAHAIGGMAAFVPSRRDPELNRVALAKVREDKVREANDGFDGTWVAHPDLVPVAEEAFDGVLGSSPNQIERKRDEVPVFAHALLDVRVPGGQVTEAGLRNNVSVGLQYLASWLGGTGAVAIFNLMEDTATAEIARSQVWQWIRHRVRTAEGVPVTRELVRGIVAEELSRIPATGAGSRRQEAGALFEEVALGESFVEFLTGPGYDRID